MDVNLIRGIVEVLVVAAFAGIAGWAYLPSRKARQESIARSIVEEDS